MTGRTSDRAGGEVGRNSNTTIYQKWLATTTEVTGLAFPGFNRTCLNPHPTRSMTQNRHICNKWFLSGKVNHVKSLF